MWLYDKLVKTFRVTEILDKLTTITIKDVAQHAGVAISTVSRVLNGLDRVSEKTRVKVSKSAEELGYVRNSLAASMKTGASQLIAVIVPDLVNEYFAAVIQGVEKAAISRGYFTIVFSSNDQKNKERELFEGALGRIIDGAIIIPSHVDMDYYKNLNMPVIIVDRYIPFSEMEAVVVNNFKGAYLLTEALIEAGHKDIAILIGPQTFNVGQERLAGFEKAMEKHGISVQKQYVQPSTWYAESGYDNTKKLLSMNKPPTAIFATNNLLCVGAMRAIAQRGLKISMDISLVGFDDSVLAEFSYPGITVVKRATVDMGRIGFEMLIERLDKTDINGHRFVTLDVEIIHRGSIKKLM